MPAVDLSNEEWQAILNVLANKCSWAEANSLLMKIGQQLQAQQQAAANPPTIATQGIKLDAKEIRQ